MRVLVTGGSGFVGSHVAEALANAGHELRLMLRATSSLEFLSGVTFERVEGDMRAPEALNAAARGVDAVVHLAGLTTAVRAADYFAVNAQGTGTLVRAAAEAGVGRFLYLSSLSAQGPNADDSGVAPPAPRPVSIYGRSKLSGEEEVLRMADRMSVTVVRAPVVYGPRDRGLLPFFRLGKSGILPVYGDGENRLSWVNVQDLASAITAVLAGETSGSVYTVADGPSHSWRELAQSLQRALDRRAWVVGVPPSLYSLAGAAAGFAGAVIKRPLLLNRDKITEMRQRFWVCSNDRITRELGWRPTISTLTGLEETVRWYRQQHWL